MSTTPRTIVYVEDDENDVFLLRRAFAKAGIAVAIHHLTDGAVAKACLQAGICESASLIVLDLNLPMMSGLEMLAWWRSYKPDSTLPVVIFSSSDNAGEQERARELGAIAYMLKPTSPAGYLPMVQKMSELMV